MRKFWLKIIGPISSDENQARQEYILNILLTAVVIMISLGALTILYKLIFSSPANYENNSLSLISIFGILIFFIFLFFLSRKGHNYLASYILLTTLFFIAAFLGYKWGVDLPAEILFFVMVIVMSGILLGSKQAFGFTILIFSAFIILGYTQKNGILTVNRTWIDEPWGYSDIIMASIILSIIAVISWLYNRELGKSLKRLKKSETDLKIERDLLEVRVEEKTKELIKAQAKEIAQVYRFAEFGKLSSGLFHDLVNPLTTVMLNVNKIKQDGKNCPELNFINSDLEQVISASQRMKEFIISVRKQISPQGNNHNFCINQEIEEAISVLNYKSRKNQIEIIFAADEKIIITGDPIKFSQIITNLLSNAIDAYDEFEKNIKEIEVNLKKSASLVKINVSDKGKGMSPDILKKIFEPFFTTKTNGDNLGLGLSLIKKIIEEDFSGSINVISDAGQGTTFTVSFPLV